MAHDGITRREFGGLALGGMALAAAAAPRRPNFLFICSDEHTGSFMGCQGHPLARTPNLDRLAARGVLFRNAYANAPVCVPGRAALMTGRFASDVDSYSNSTCFAGNGVPTWGNLLRDAGYHCWATGKLDLTEGVDYGFHEVETDHGHSTNPDITSLFRSPVGYRVDTRKQVDGAFTRRVHHDERRVTTALGFLREQAPKLDRPWAAFVGLTLPHPPFTAHERFAEMFRPEKMPLPNIPPGHLENLPMPHQVLRDFLRVTEPIPPDRVRRARAAYLGMLAELDEHVGRLIGELDRQGLAANTIVIYTSDHGEMLGEHGLWMKMNLYENAARIPMIVAGPGVPAGTTVDKPASAVDLTPTLLELASAPMAAELRGHSLFDAAHPGVAYSESGSEGNCTGSYMIRKGPWKFVHFTWHGNLLFNLEQDAGEFHNLAGTPEHREIERELDGILRSMVDPDAVTRRGFDRHDAVLRDIVARNDAEQFYKLLEKRLGPVQARSLTYRHYHRA